jgi:hypothetical protein
LGSAFLGGACLRGSFGGLVTTSKWYSLARARVSGV